VPLLEVRGRAVLPRMSKTLVTFDKMPGALVPSLGCEIATWFLTNKRVRVSAQRACGTSCALTSFVLYDVTFPQVPKDKDSVSAALFQLSLFFCASIFFVSIKVRIAPP